MSTTEDVRARVEEKLRELRYVSMAGHGERGLMEHHIDALTEFILTPDFLAALGEQEPVAWMVEYQEVDGSWQRETEPFYHEDDAITNAASYEPWDGTPCARIVPLYARPYIEGEPLSEDGDER